MAAADRVPHIPPDTRVEADPTPGDGPGASHRGGGTLGGIGHDRGRDDLGQALPRGFETSIHVLSGQLRMESGPGGHEVIQAVAGEFLHVHARAVHRESNPSDGESRIVVVRAGHGAPTINIDGPA